MIEFEVTSTLGFQADFAQSHRFAEFLAVRRSDPMHLGLLDGVNPYWGPGLRTEDLTPEAVAALEDSALVQIAVTLQEMGFLRPTWQVSTHTAKAAT